MLKFLRRLALILLVLGCLLLIYFNLRLYFAPDCIAAPNGWINTDVVQQLHFLRKALHQENAAEAMQDQYPEGYVFLHSLYSLTWCEVAETLETDDPARQEAMQQITLSLRAMESPLGKSVFDPNLPLEYGAFYQGWTTYLRGRLLRLSAPDMRDAQLLAQFQMGCTKIAQAFAQTDQPYLETYQGATWPADNIVCLAALSLHDKIINSRFLPVKVEWLNRMKRTLVPEYGLLPHDYARARGAFPASVRGSSQSLLLIFLPEIDSAFAAEQYRNFRKHFLAYRMGLPGIREYPRGKQGSGDIDSGPIVLGIGGVATIVGIKAVQQFNDWDLAVALRNGTETLLFPQQTQTEKTYLLGKLPILDAFLAWSNAGICKPCLRASGTWRLPFQGISLLIVAVLVFFLYKIRIRKT